VHGQVVGLVAPDQILRFFLRGVDSVSVYPLNVISEVIFLLDRAPDSACFRVPLNMIPNLKSCVIGIISQASPMLEWCKEQVRMWAAPSPESSPQSLSSEDLFSGFVCIDLNAIAGGNMRVREHLEFDEPV
jgi:hypothetical protein